LLNAAGRKWRGISDQRHLTKVSGISDETAVIGLDDPTIRDVNPDELSGHHIAGSDVASPSGQLASPSTDEFRDDDLGRLQRILIGDYVQQTNDRLETLERALIGALGDLRESIDTRFNSMENRLDQELTTRTEAVAEVSAKMTEESRIRARAQNLLRRDMDAGFEKTTRLIDELETRVEASVEQTRGDLHAEVESSVSSLESQTVSRSGLIKALLGAAEKLEENRRH